jgi:hypothetical protein
MTLMTATQTYNKRRTEIDDLLIAIKSGLTMMDEVEADHPLDWGFAGNAGHIKATLTEILDFVEPGEHTND